MKGYGFVVYGILENGFVYGFLFGDVFNIEIIVDFYIFLLVVCYMVWFYVIEVDYKNFCYKVEFMLFNGMMKYLNFFLDKFEDFFKNER